MQHINWPSETVKGILVLKFLLAVLLLTSCSDALETGLITLRPDRAGVSITNSAADRVALGKMVYATHCASCHGANLEGEANWQQQNEDGSFRAPPHTVDGHTWHHADSVLIETIEEGGDRFENRKVGGASNMPAFADILTEEEITAVLTFIKSTWPEDVRALQQQQTIQNAAQ